jgi:hypothetical protein
MISESITQEYIKILKPELRKAIQAGEPDRAASFARELAKLHRKRQISKKTTKKGDKP